MTRLHRLSLSILFTFLLGQGFATAWAQSNVLVIYVPSPGIGNIAVRIAAPTVPRYPVGAGIVIEVAPFLTTSSGFAGGDAFTELGLIDIAYLWPGCSDAVAGAASDGVFDYGGPNDIQAFRDVIRFTLGLIPNSDNRYLADLLTITPLTNHVGLYAFSHPGIAVVNVLADFGPSLNNGVAWFVGRENPTLDTLTAMELGHFDDNITVTNPAYSYPRDYTATNITISYASVWWTTNFRGNAGPFFDLNSNHVVDISTDYMLGTRIPSMYGKLHYSMALTQALTNNGALSLLNWPSHVATPAEARSHWPYRNSTSRYPELSAACSNLKVMLVFGLNDHAQGAPDKPHIHQAYQGFRNGAGLWTRLNPDRTYVNAMNAEVGATFPDNPANTEPVNWAYVAAWSFSNQSVLANTLALLSAVAEMADRHYTTNWAADITNVLVTHTNALATPANVSASDGTYTDKISVTWSPVTGATGYGIWRSTTNQAESATAQATVSQPCYDDPNTTATLSYYYRITALNLSTTSSWSAADSGYRALDPVDSSGSADLALTHLLILPAVFEAGAHPTLATCVLKNYGVSDLSGANTRVLLDFFLSTNSLFGDIDDRWIGDFGANAEIAASQAITLTVPEAALAGVTIPSDAAGEYHLFARVRPAYPSTLLDTNTEHNVTCRKGTLAVGVSGSWWPVTGDYDGDGKTDPALYQEASGYWAARLSSMNYGLAVLAGFGQAGCMPIPADYDGDRKADPAVVDLTTGTFYARLSSAGYGEAAYALGGYGYELAADDYDGDRKSDLAFYQSATGWWYVLLAGAGVMVPFSFGSGLEMPVTGDYDSDGKADPVLYQESDAAWQAKLSGSGYALASATFGGLNLMPVAGDVDGDGKADLLLYREQTGEWQASLSASGYATVTSVLGGCGFTAVSGDYDGDGRADLAVCQSALTLWSFRLSTRNYAQVDFPFCTSSMSNGYKKQDKHATFFRSH